MINPCVSKFSFQMKKKDFLKLLRKVRLGQDRLDVDPTFNSLGIQLPPLRILRIFCSRVIGVLYTGMDIGTQEMLSIGIHWAAWKVPERKGKIMIQNRMNINVHRIYKGAMLLTGLLLASWITTPIDYNT